MITNIDFKRHVATNLTQSGNVVNATHTIRLYSGTAPTDPDSYDATTYSSQLLAEFNNSNVMVVESASGLNRPPLSYYKDLPTNYIYTNVITAAGTATWAALIQSTNHWICSVSDASGNGPLYLAKTTFAVGDNVAIIDFNLWFE